jgi:hypothetical protein
VYTSRFKKSNGILSGRIGFRIQVEALVCELPHRLQLPLPAAALTFSFRDTARSNYRRVGNQLHSAESLLNEAVPRNLALLKSAACVILARLKLAFSVDTFELLFEFSVIFA